MVYYTEEQIQHGVQVIKAAGLCGELAPDSSGICLKDPGHKDGHGWESSADAVAQSLTAFFSVERTPEEAAAEYLAAYNLRSDQLEEAWSQIEDLRTQLEDADRDRNEMRVLLSNRVTSANVYGCRYCGIFAFSPPVIHRPESSCAPDSYEMWTLEHTAAEAKDG